MYNNILDEYNHMIWENLIDEVKIMINAGDDDIDLNDTDKCGRTMMLQAVESTEFFEDNGVFKPQEKWLDFIEWLLKQGTDPNLPENDPPIKYVLEYESDISSQKECVYDLTDILLLLKRYGADSSEYDEYINGKVQDRLNYKWDRNR